MGNFLTMNETICYLALLRGAGAAEKMARFIFLFMMNGMDLICK
jgi:hypothetical protein